jgi:hypothetical protein
MGVDPHVNGFVDRHLWQAVAPWNIELELGILGVVSYVAVNCQESPQ